MNLDEKIIEILRKTPSALPNLLKEEAARQDEVIELIASENYPSDAVRAVQACSFGNKYAEGYPHNRYYGGCKNADILEQYCQKIWKMVFDTDYHVNVQPHSGTQANLAAYAAFCEPGDIILSMDLNSGGHLSHGSRVNQSGKLYKFIHYGVNEEGYINWGDLLTLMRIHLPQLIVLGASAYSAAIPFAAITNQIKTTAKEVRRSAKTEEERHYNPIVMADIAHIAGLIAAKEHPSPFGFVDVVTTTTHKTLRGPRSGLIFCKPEYAKAIDAAVFPGTQGGPHLHTIAAKAVCGEEALQADYKEYIHQVMLNAQAMANKFIALGYDVLTHGTDNHLFIINFSKTHPNLTGKDVQELLEKHNIIVNKNCVPNEQRSPRETSGIRIGTPAMTTKGYKEEDFVELAVKIDSIIKEATTKNTNDEFNQYFVELDKAIAETMASVATLDESLLNLEKLGIKIRNYENFKPIINTIEELAKTWEKMPFEKEKE